MGYSVQSNTISTFIANSAALNAICGEIDGNIGSSIPQPVLVIGQEGSGKTTLLRSLITNTLPYTLFGLTDASYSVPLISLNKSTVIQSLS